MAPFKKIKTYQHISCKSAAESEKAFNDLLARNLKKRIETSKNCDSSSDTTFDRLKKGVAYNNVKLKAFPENCFMPYYDSSATSTFCDNKNDENNANPSSSSSLNQKFTHSKQPSLKSANYLKSFTDNSCNHAEFNNCSELENVSKTAKNNLPNRSARKFATVNAGRSPIVTRSKLGNCRILKNDRKWESGLSEGSEVSKKSIFMSSLQLSEKKGLIDSLTEGTSDARTHVTTDNLIQCENNSHLGSTSYTFFKNLIHKGSTPLFKKKRKNYSSSVNMNSDIIEIDYPLDPKTTPCSQDEISRSVKINSSSLMMVSASTQEWLNNTKNCNNLSRCSEELTEGNSSISLKTSKNKDTRTSSGKDCHVVRESSPEATQTFLLPEKNEFQKVLVASTPLREIRLSHLQSDGSKSLFDTLGSNAVNKSYEIINRWNYKCPSPESFRVNIHSSVNDSSRNPKHIPKINKLQFKDSKLKKKTMVILNIDPKLNSLIKRNKKYVINLSSSRLKGNRTSKFATSFRKTLNKITKHKRKRIPQRSGRKMVQQNGPVVLLTPLQVSQVQKKFKTSRSNYTSVIAQDKSTSKHECSKECRCFFRSPRVLLNRLDGLYNCQTYRQTISPHTVIDLTETSTDSDEAEPSTEFSLRQKFQPPEIDLGIIKHCYVRLEPIDNYINLANSVSSVDERSFRTSIARRSKFEERNNSALSPNKSKRKTLNVDLTPSKPLKLTPSEARGQHIESHVESAEVSDVIDSSFLPMELNKFFAVKPGKKFRRSICYFKNIKRDIDTGTLGGCGEVTNHKIRRSSIRVVAVSRITNKHSDLVNYAAETSGYVSRLPSRENHLQIIQNQLPALVEPVEDIHATTVHEKSSIRCTARDIVLRRCRQTEALSFEQCYPPSALRNCQKIGEGVYGEVFMFRDKDGSTTVMKVIPIEGNQIVNLEKQKTFEEIISELVISMELSNLRNGKRNSTDAFGEVKNVRCVQGCYPERLLELWELYDDNKKSENDSPDIFLEDQLYIVLELSNGGCDLEAFQFKNAEQSLAVFKQVACALAVAETEFRFEHRDLHWGNVLVKYTQKKSSTFVVDGNVILIENKDAKATIIDFTLSRIEKDGLAIYNDLAMDVDLFSAKGDYQFEIYKLMQKSNGNEWRSFQPYSNVLWLHYLLDKAITAFHYKNTKSKLHGNCLTKLVSYKNKILDYKSVNDFVLENFL